MITINTKIEYGSVWDFAKDYEGREIPGTYKIWFNIADAPGAYQDEIQAARQIHAPHHGPAKWAVATSNHPIKLTEINGRYDEFEKMLRLADLRNIYRARVLANGRVDLVCNLVNVPTFEFGKRNKLTVSEIIFDIDKLGVA